MLMGIFSFGFYGRFSFLNLRIQCPQLTFCIPIKRIMRKAKPIHFGKPHHNIHGVNHKGIGWAAPDRKYYFYAPNFQYKSEYSPAYLYCQMRLLVALPSIGCQLAIWAGS